MSPLSLEKVFLSSLLRQVIEKERVPEGIDLVLPQNDLTVVCDRRKIEVAFVNLIRNAVDAALPHGKIQARIIDLGDKVRIEIEDSGKGIPPEDQAKIFDPLFTTKMVGMGLGLTSVKNIVTEHGGTITFSNNPTIFVVEIPKMPKNFAA
jgi:signal transduction histidine kinase